MIDRVFADHNFSESILKQLERRGIGVTRARAVNLQEADDPDVLAWAAEFKMPVLSHDVRTMRRYADDRLEAELGMAGWILVHQWVSVGQALTDLLWLFRELGGDDLEGQVRFVPLSDRAQ